MDAAVRARTPFPPLRATIALSLATIAALAGVIMAPATPAMAVGTVDVSNTETTGAALNTVPGHLVQQSFVAGRTGRLTSVRILVTRATAPLTVSVHGAGGQLAQPVTVPPLADDWVDTWVEIPLPEAPLVEAGLPYRLEIASTGFTSFPLNDRYAAGALNWPDWMDLLFETLVESAPAAPSDVHASVIHGTDGGVLEVTWSDPVGIGRGDVIQLRATQTGSLTTVPAGVGSTQIDHPGMVAGQTVSVDVRAVTALGQTSPWTTVSTIWSTSADAPSGLTASPAGDRRVALVWTAPPWDGASAITGYVAQVRAVGTQDWVDAPLTDVDGTTGALTGLEPLVPQEVRVAAVNQHGAGAWSAEAAVVPQTVAGAPTWASATALDGAVALALDAPTVTGGGTTLGYVVEHRATGSETWSVPSELAVVGDDVVVSDLENGVSYDFRASLTTSVGAGAWSEVVAIAPRTTAGAPTALAAQPGPGSIALSWSAPTSDGGAPITAYRVRYGVDGTWVEDGMGVTVSGTSAVITGLPDGVAVEVEVAAINAAGLGSPATAIATPFSPASAPTDMTATPFDGGVDVTWRAPADDGGAAIAGYVVEHRAGDGPWSTDGVLVGADGATIDGLANGTPVEVRVAATNGAIGAWASIVATPFVLDPSIVGPSGIPLGGTTLRMGDEITVTAERLPAGAVVELLLQPASESETDGSLMAAVASPSALGAAAIDAGGLSIGRAEVDADGTLSLAGALPSDLAPGSYVLVVDLSDGDVRASVSSAPFAVEAAPAPPQPQEPSIPAPPPAQAPAPTAPAPTAVAGAAHDALPQTGAEPLALLVMLGVALAAAGGLVRRRAAR
ncbi:fibronectin type III domain-containing protein [Agrococcus sp. SGAir0287]|uniref:fibronectin type III domain-containing protein n=1 Tax=Agrococcus sp. SGAir0287 TaxID=2070347 RepID=UPI0010CD57DD|nr:fibronectin type III domain-containing protein [Agrococcus sp. SGAir0287]QCR18249.1 hypothetical protein C1N71_01285 [Agrococcus sp. SGAir0287]